MQCNKGQKQQHYNRACCRGKDAGFRMGPCGDGPTNMITQAELVAMHAVVCHLVQERGVKQEMGPFLSEYHMHKVWRLWFMENILTSLWIVVMC